jgi:hypothetical protein
LTVGIFFADFAAQDAPALFWSDPQRIIPYQLVNVMPCTNTNTFSEMAGLL